MLHVLIILFKINNSILLGILCFMINFLTPVCNWLLTWIHYVHFYLNLVTFQEFSRFPVPRLPVVLTYRAYSCRLQYVNYVWPWRFDVFIPCDCTQSVFIESYSPLLLNLSFGYSCYFRLISSIEALLCEWYVCICYTRVCELGFKFLCLQTS